MTTDLVAYQTTTSLEMAEDAWRLAQRMAGTPFVPAQLRGKPESVLAAILTGHELGIGPMNALAKIHVIDGRPSIAAELMRAVIIRAGHEIWIEESTNTRCVIAGLRAGSDRTLRITWTQDDAKAAGLIGKDNWRKYPRAMLVARATGELARGLFPDVLAGITYTQEELSDGDLLDDEDVAGTEEPSERPSRPRNARKAAKKVTKARGRKMDPEEPSSASEPARERPELPGDEEPDPHRPAEEPEDAEVIDVESEELEMDPEEARRLIQEEFSLPAEEPPDGADHPGDRPAHEGPQAIAIAMSRHGITKREDRLEVIAGILGRPVVSSKDLEPEDVTRVLQELGLEAFDPAAYLGEPEPELEPEEWDGDRWRTFLRSVGWKVGEALPVAAELAEEAFADPPKKVDEIAGLGIAEALRDRLAKEKKK